MIMKKVLKHIFIGICGALLSACMIMACIAGSASRESLTCKGVDITILDSMRNSFVSRADIMSYLDKEYGKYIGEKLDSLNLARIEDIVDGRSAVMKSHAYVTKDGLLHIDVTQRSPIVRFQKSGGGFYADKEGFIFPLQRTYASHVQIIDGHIPLAANSGYKGAIESPEEMEWFRKTMNLVNHIEKERKWRDKIVQISVAEGGDMILVPREGDEIFIFGQPEAIQEKFSKMEKYYTHIIPAKGEGHYRTVDLRFAGQIVCKEK